MLLYDGSKNKKYSLMLGVLHLNKKKKGLVAWQVACNQMVNYYTLPGSVVINFPFHCWITRVSHILNNL